MRLKNVRGASDVIKASKYVIENPNDYKGNFKELFNNDNPIHVEIGMGKGQFITGMAKAFPEINFIGIEMYDSVIVRAVQKQDELELPNLKLIKVDATGIEDIFDHEIDTLYLNFHLFHVLVHLIFDYFYMDLLLKWFRNIRSLNLWPS